MTWPRGVNKGLDSFLNHKENDEIRSYLLNNNILSRAKNGIKAELIPYIVASGNVKITTFLISDIKTKSFI